MDKADDVKLTERMLDSSRISVVIATYQAERWIRPCLESLFADSAGDPLDIWIVDNASTDLTVEVIKQHFPKVNVLQNVSNFGFAAAVNKGLQAAFSMGAEYAILVNQDMTVPDNWMNNFLSFTRGEPGIYASLELTYDGRGIEPIARKNLFEQIPELGDDLLFGRLKERYPASTVYGGCIAIHRTVCEKIGYFDENFFMYCEDIDFCRRAIRAGIKIWILPFWRVYHHSSMSSKGGYDDPRINRFNRRGWMILELKNSRRSFSRALFSLIRRNSRVLFGALTRLDMKSSRDCISDFGWLMANYSKIKSARKRDIF